MRKGVAIGVVALLVVGGLVPGAEAYWGPGAAVAAGAFAAFSLLLWPPLLAASLVAPVYAAPVRVPYAPPVYSAPVRYAVPMRAPLVQRQVVYPHGRYVLYGDGVSRAYQWVWVSAPPPPPPAPPIGG